MEILAPAGDMEMLRAAVFSGADCVYLGVAGFNARRGAENFEGESLGRAVAFCRGRGCRVYAALNTLVLPGREAAFAGAVASARDAGCDGLIVQDLGGARLAQQIAPALPLHASTQMSVHSPAGVRMMAELGFSRVILAREMSEGEIGAAAEAAREANIELEVFAHGALCVSVSGQCMMSAFLGGRSGNLGACAGPCRLPFRAEIAAAEEDPAETATPEASCHHLSLKDLSVLDALPRLAAMGVASAKIEGRLRGPEYVAVAVDSARKALRGEEYDRDLLRDIFSREGFTDGWFTGENGGEMFGARTGADSAAAKAALPRARELYRREAPRVPVEMSLDFDGTGWTLTLSDGTHEIRERVDASSPAGATVQTTPDDGQLLPLRAALAKTGGTPFYVRDPDGIKISGQSAPPSPGAAKAARRQGLERLLALREAPPGPLPAPDPAPLLPKRGQRRKSEDRPILRARFAHPAGVPAGVEDICKEILLPLFEAKEVPVHLRARTRLWLPRVLFGGRETAARQLIEKTKTMGFAGYWVENIAHLGLCAGLPMAGGIGLNTANALTAAAYGALGCGNLTLSPELSLAQMEALVSALPESAPRTDALGYGRLPLMVSRACPLRNVAGCGGCPGQGSLVDRKGAAFPVACDGGIGQGTRTIYNPVPLWMGDRLEALPTDTATLYFTSESAAQAAEILGAFQRGESAPGPFTRGLYSRGTAK